MRKQINGFYVPEIKNAYEIISNKAIAQAEEIYGVPLHEKISERLKWELDAIKKHHHEIYFYISEQLVRKAYELGYRIFPCINWGASLVAYLLGITDINPLPLHYVCGNCRHTEFTHTYNDNRCPECGAELRVDGYDLAIETLLAADGSKVPHIMIWAPMEMHSQCEKMLYEILPNEKIIRREGILKYHDDYYILPRFSDVDDTDDIRYLSDRFIKVSIVRQRYITLLVELQRQTGIAVECDVCEVLRSIRNKPTIFADDIIHKLTSCGVPTFKAYKFMKAVQRGAFQSGGKGVMQIDTLDEYGVPTEYIASLEKITYLPTKAEAVRDAKIERALALYDKHYPREFMEACEKYGLL